MSVCNSFEKTYIFFKFLLKEWIFWWLVFSCCRRFFGHFAVTVVVVNVDTIPLFCGLNHGGEWSFMWYQNRKEIINSSSSRETKLSEKKTSFVRFCFLQRYSLKFLRKKINDLFTRKQQTIIKQNINAWWKRRKKENMK